VSWAKLVRDPQQLHTVISKVLVVKTGQLKTL